MEMVSLSQFRSHWSGLKLAIHSQVGCQCYGLVSLMNGDGVSLTVPLDVHAQEVCGHPKLASSEH
jgi:hypothetical protein